MIETVVLFRSVDDDAEAYDLCDTCPLGRKLCDEDRRTVEPVMRYKGERAQRMVIDYLMRRDDAGRLTCYMREQLVEKFGPVDAQ